MTEESLLTEEVRAMIGRSTAPVRCMLTGEGVRRAVEVYTGKEVPTPPDGSLAPAFAIDALETGREGIAMPSLMPNSIVISNEWQFERPLVVGEEFEARGVLADISERFGGRFGYGIYIRTEYRFSDGEGVIAARSVTTMMQYDARNARGGDDDQ